MNLPRRPALLFVPLGGAALILVLALTRSRGTTPPPGAGAGDKSPAPTGPSEAPSRPSFTPGPPPPPPPADPVIRRWHASVRNKDQRGILESQAAFRERESDYRGPLERLGADDPDPRVRAFTISLLGRFRSPPPESFFIERLPDPSEFPRESALAALDRLGTSACLPSVDRIAAGDPVEAVRRAAARAAAAVRNR